MPVVSLTDWGPLCHGGGSYGSEDPAGCRFCFLGNPKGRRLLRGPQFCPQNLAYGCAKISGEPVQSMCLQGILVVPLLASILRSWHQGSWN